MVYWETLGEPCGRFALSRSFPAPMNPFVEGLPLRVAALAGLMVGGISLAIGADAWTCLLRVGAAFFVFGLLGLVLRAIMQQGSAAPPSGRRASDKLASEQRGQRLDQETPAETREEPDDPAAKPPAH